MLFTKVNFKKKPLALALITLTILIQVVGSFKTVSASVSLIYFHAIPGPDYIKLEWETAQELDNLGFNIYRGLTNNVNTAQKINSSLIPGNNSTTGSYYEWIDNNVQVGTLYYYWLEDIDIYGAATKHGPESATPGSGNTIPTVPSGGGNNSTLTPTPTRTPTATASPTSQLTATPSRTPTRTPTSQPTSSTSNSNPTVTTAAQPQATAASNNFAATSAPQNSEPATPEVVSQENDSPNNEQPTALPDSAGNTAETAGEDTTSSIALSQSGTETESEGKNLGNAIGQNATTSDGNVTSRDGAAESSNRSTIVLMALIASVILLIAGGGGIAVLLLNRNKQSRT